MFGGQEDTVSLPQEEVSGDTRRHGVGMEKATAQITGGEVGELGGGGRFVEFEPDPRVASMELPEDGGQDRSHRETREGDAHESPFSRSGGAGLIGE
jgi:hypothetical protein